MWMTHLLFRFANSSANYIYGVESYDPQLEHNKLDLTKRNAKTFPELYLADLEWFDEFDNQTKNKPMGNLKNKHVWVKRLKITPLRMSISREEEVALN